jgi:hypothetical protein
VGERRAVAFVRAALVDRAARADERAVDRRLRRFEHVGDLGGREREHVA